MKNQRNSAIELLRILSMAMIVLSHICSDRLKVFLGLAGESHPLGQFFTELEKSLSFQKWFFASLHLDKPIPPKHQCVYQQILPLL